MFHSLVFEKKNIITFHNLDKCKTCSLYAYTFNYANILILKITYLFKSVAYFGAGSINKCTA